MCEMCKGGKKCLQFTSKWTHLLPETLPCGQDFLISISVSNRVKNTVRIIDPVLWAYTYAYMSELKLVELQKLQKEMSVAELCDKPAKAQPVSCLTEF